GRAVAVSTRWRKAAGDGRQLQVAAVARARRTHLEQALGRGGAYSDPGAGGSQNDGVVLADQRIGTDGGGIAQLGGGAGTGSVAEEGVVRAAHVGVGESPSHPCEVTQSGVEAARGVVEERKASDGDIVDARGVGKQRLQAGGRVAAARVV